MKIVNKDNTHKKKIINNIISATGLPATLAKKIIDNLAYVKLKKISIYGDFEFNGFIEGNKITEGESNVIVTDGFTGNIALKTAEGTVQFITDSLKKSLTSTLLSKFSIIFSYFALKKFKEKLDPRKFNGAIFLGLKGPVVKSHGSTDAVGFYHSIDLCCRIIKGDLMNKIKNNLSHINEDVK